MSKKLRPAGDYWHLKVSTLKVKDKQDDTFSFRLLATCTAT